MCIHSAHRLCTITYYLSKCIYSLFLFLQYLWLYVNVEYCRSILTVCIKLVHYTMFHVSAASSQNYFDIRFAVRSQSLRVKGLRSGEPTVAANEPRKGKSGRKLGRKKSKANDQERERSKNGCFVVGKEQTKKGKKSL